MLSCACSTVALPAMFAGAPLAAAVVAVALLCAWRHFVRRRSLRRTDFVGNGCSTHTRGGWPMVESRAAVAVRAVTAPALAAVAWTAHAHDDAIAEAGEWRMEAWVAALLLCSALAYARGAFALRRRAGDARAFGRRHIAAFAAGWLATLVALAPPLDPLATRFFSLHMLQHELLMIVAAPLLALGRPFVAWSWAAPRAAQAVHRAFQSKWLAAVWRWATGVSGAWLLHAIALWLWHAPPLFQAALTRPLVHDLQHATFFITALLFWWSILGARAAARAGGAMLALFTTMLHTGVLGALLALSTRVWYPAYAALGEDALRDQQLGGLLMWVPGGVAYLAAALWLATRLLGAGTARETPLEGFARDRHR
jgi:cytochrome c oxidase assembly factor CtaG